MQRKKREGGRGGGDFLSPERKGVEKKAIRCKMSGNVACKQRRRAVREGIQIDGD